ncbi:protein YAE1 homolog [Hemicordylus capensis]|uniref:protein YAE1 homolog n=1 Tax=Hemicordylus capensis TaxID=884348 RepID=UPI002304C997|nr:protein YAE1 homolog [Hemicordylus capensis]
MSWVGFALNRPDEDVFDEDADELDLAQNEWKSTMKKRVKEGYREGVEAGKKLTLQQGFNKGYEEAAKRMFSCGQLKGLALLSWCHHKGCDSAPLSEMTDLLNEVGKYEESVLKDLSYTHSQPHVGDLLDTIEDVDLGPVLSPEKQCSRTTGETACENGTEPNGNCCRNDNGTNCFQGECCRRTNEHRVSERPTLTQLKDKAISLVQQLGLSPDTTEHIQLLQG